MIKSNEIIGFCDFLNYKLSSYIELAIIFFALAANTQYAFLNSNGEFLFMAICKNELK